MPKANVKKPDRLSALISRFHVQARVVSFVPKSIAFGAEADGREVGDNDSSENSWGDAPEDKSNEDGANFFIAQFGQLEEQVRRQISASDRAFSDLPNDTPLLVFYPRGVPFYEKSEELIETGGAGDRTVPEGYVCAAVDTGGVANPIALALPDLVVVRLDQSKPLQAVSSMLMEEANAPRCGGQAVIDRLCEIVVIRLLRHLIEAGQAEVGLLAGLAHPNLAMAIVAIHDNPERNFHLEDLAEIAAMSRTHFVNSFRKSVGVTPGQYLSNWRLTLARMEIAKGTPLKAIARRIGFSSSAALSRAFTRHYGVNPRTEMPQN